MPTGIDVGESTIVVATEGSITRLRNELLAADTDGDDGGPVVETDEGPFELATVEGDRGEPAPEARLVGAEAGADPTRRAVLAGLVEEYADAEDPAVGYAVRDGSGGEVLRAVLAADGYDPVAVEPGLAVFADVLDEAATGLAVVVDSGTARGTLVVGGVPVATATVPVADQWFELDGGPEDRGGSTDEAEGGTSLSERWRGKQYEALFGDLGAALARRAPAVEGPVAVAVGGELAPRGLTDNLQRGLAHELPFEVGPVTVPETPGDAVARGARELAGMADIAPATPAVGAGGTVATAAGAYRDGMAAVEAGSHQGVTGGDESEAGQMTDASDADTGLGAGRSADLSSRLGRVERRETKTAETLSELVSRVDAGTAGTGGVEGLDETVTDLRERLPELESRVAALDEAAVDPDAISGLESSLDSVEESVSALESDTRKLRAVLVGFDTDDELDAPDVSDRQVEELRTDALRDDVDELQNRLGDELHTVRQDVEELDARLVDLAATVEAVPDVEDEVRATRDSVADLRTELESVRETLDGYESDLAALEERAATTAQLDGLAEDLSGVSDDVDALARRFEDQDRVEPEAVEELRTNLDGLRRTVIARTERIESLEEQRGELEDRIDTVYRDTAKSEALSSLETEVSRVRSTATDAAERTSEMDERVGTLEESVEGHEERLGMLSTNVDNLAGNAVSRPEVNAEIDDVTDRIESLEAELESVRELAEERPDVDVEPAEPEDAVSSLSITLLVFGLSWVGVAGAVLAVLSQQLLVAPFFLLFSILPGFFAWLLS